MVRFHLLEEDTEKKVSDFLKTEISLPNGIRFKFVGDTKQQKLAHITIPTGRNKLLLDCDIVVTINEFAFLAMFTDKYHMLKTLLINEFVGLVYNMDKGDMKLQKHDIVTSKSVISSISIENVIAAKEMEQEIIKSINDQIKDGKLSLEPVQDGLESVTDEEEED